jgi:hypothetical protein
MTYKVKLIKLSATGWTKTYDNDIDLKAELYKHICGSCRSGCIEKLDDGEDWEVWQAVNENSDIGDMLATSCGCEYDIEEEDEREY